MAENQQSMAVRPDRPNGISKNVYFLTIAVVAVVGFVAGTRSQELLAVIGPALGFKVETSTLDLAAVQRTYQQLKANYDGTLDANKLIDGASKGLVAAAGDQYTVFMDADEARQFNDDLAGKIGGGIGVEIGVRDGKPTILRVLADNPAEKAGLKAGDVILGVNDQSTNNWQPDKVSAAVRGDVGTTVKLTIGRGTETKDITITRAEVNNPSVESKVENGIGILTITRFDQDTGSLAQKAAQSFKQQNVTGVILDLRGNGGGYVDAAKEVAGLWVAGKTIATEKTNGKVTDTITAGDNAILAGLPTTVLVNGSSASASEIVAGALQDYKVATLIGEKTFGKGTVQKVIDLGGGTQLKVTIARWYTPNGKNITKEGIEPDKKVELTAADSDAGKDPQLEAARQQLGA